MRKAIARRLTSAATLIPHFYLTVDCRIDQLLAARARLNAQAPEGGYKLSVNDFVVKASALALVRVPEVNASWTDTAILRHRHADIGVAVALDFGLITPIVFQAESKGLAAISSEVKSLAERARAKQLKPQEYEGGGFAISNLGMFGIKKFTAVINPPQAAILAVGAGEERAVVRDGEVETADGDDRDDVLRSSRDRRRDRRQVSRSFQDLRRRPGDDAAVVRQFVEHINGRNIRRHRDRQRPGQAMSAPFARRNWD